MKIKKIFPDAVAIATASSRAFLPYTGVMIRSITACMDRQRTYDIIVITSVRDRIVERQIQKENDFENVSIRFFLADDILPGISCFTYGHFSKETYFKLFLPFAADAYDKVLFLDGDVIVCRDPALLYDMDMGKALVGASLDADTAGLYHGARKGRKQYTDKVLKLRDPDRYFQAGVIVFHIAAWKSQAITADSMAALIASKKWELLDQDILNVLCERLVKEIPMQWNVLADFSNIRIRKHIAKAPENLKEQYKNARRKPYIIHFAGPVKPWRNPWMDYAQAFWDCARQTSFYEMILYRRIEEVKLENRLRAVIRNKIQQIFRR